MTGRRREVGPPRVGRARCRSPRRRAGRQRLAVGLAVGDDGLDAELAAGAQDAQRDLAAVGDQDPCGTSGQCLGLDAPHGRAPSLDDRTSSWPYSTASPASTRLAPTMPSTGATTSWRRPACRRAEAVAGADPRAGRELRRAGGRSRPPARWRRPATSATVRRPAAWVVAGRRRRARAGRPSRPGPTRLDRGRRAGRAAARDRRGRARRSAGAAGRRSRTRQRPRGPRARPARSRRAWRRGPAAARRRARSMAAWSAGRSSADRPGVGRRLERIGHR